MKAHKISWVLLLFIVLATVASATIIRDTNSEFNTLNATNFTAANFCDYSSNCGTVAQFLAAGTDTNETARVNDLFANYSAFLVDTNTQLSEATVDSYADNNGYFDNINDFTGTLTTNKWCIYDGSEIDCNVEPVVDTDVDTNETTRVNNLVNTACSSGNFVYNFSQDGTPLCDAPAGSGDVTAVYTTAPYLTGGSDSGDITLVFNSTMLYDTNETARVNDLFANYSAFLVDTDTDTQVSAEGISDNVSTMVTGNTETRIAVTYDDADNTLDFVVDDMNDDTPDNDAEVPDAISIAGTSSQSYTFEDDVKVYFGDSNDVYIMFNGTGGYGELG